MSLYPEARTNLSDAHRKTLDLWEAETWSIEPEGPNVLTNIRNESHLVGNSAQAGSLALQGFLRGIATRFRRGKAKQAFEGTVIDYLLKGRHVVSNPSTLYRFWPVDRFGKMVAQANGELSLWQWNRDEYVTNLIDNWNTLGRQKLSRAMLGKYPSVFVTFEKSDGGLVTNAFHFGPEIMDALGVRLESNQDVIGLRYSPPDDFPIKYPTVADGGWCQDFAAPRPTDEHGWTRPISNPLSQGWPEAVHENRRADLVAEMPSRYFKK